jgi:hypothetical protein
MTLFPAARLQRSCIAIPLYYMYNALKNDLDNSEFILVSTAGIRKNKEVGWTKNRRRWEP